MKLLILFAALTIALALLRRKIVSKKLGIAVAVLSLLTIGLAFTTMKRQSRVPLSETQTVAGYNPKVYVANTGTADPPPFANTGGQPIPYHASPPPIQYEESKPEQALGAASGVIMGALKFVGIGSQPQLDEGQRSIGYSFGKSIAQRAASGRVVVLQMPVSLVGFQLSQVSQIHGLEEAFEGTGLKIVGLEDRQEFINGWREVYHTSRVSAELMRVYLSTYPDAVAIVSFVGLPNCQPKDLPGLPPLYCFGNPDDLSNEVWKASGLVKQFATP